MKLARILLPIHPECDIAPAAQAAFALAKRFSSSVEGIYPAPRPVDQLIIQDEAGAPMQYDKLLAEVKQRSENERKQAEKLFQRHAKHFPDIASDFVSGEGSIGGIIAQRGRLSDITVLGAKQENDQAADFWAEVRDGAIFQSAHPIVIAPRVETISNALGETLVIAWKDSVEAARAVAAARPLIARAKAVHIVTAGADSADENSLKDLEEYLALYNANIETHSIGKQKRNVAELLAGHAVQYDDGLLVMGAYSQWRWKEWAFGGVTQFMLENTPVPVLMMH